MGCGMSTEEKEGKARNEEIENQLKKDRMMQRNEIKMLLLGTCQIALANKPARRPGNLSTRRQRRRVFAQRHACHHSTGAPIWDLSSSR